MHVDVVEADDCVPADVCALVCEVAGDCVREGLDNPHVHDAGDQT